MERAVALDKGSLRGVDTRGASFDNEPFTVRKAMQRTDNGVSVITLANVFVSGEGIITLSDCHVTVFIDKAQERTDSNLFAPGDPLFTINYSGKISGPVQDPILVQSYLQFLEDHGAYGPQVGDS